jgi:hypothetical protein
VAGSCEHSNEPSRFVKCRELFDQLNDEEVLKEDSGSLNRVLNLCNTGYSACLSWMKNGKGFEDTGLIRFIRFYNGCNGLDKDRYKGICSECRVLCLGLFICLPDSC